MPAALRCSSVARQSGVDYSQGVAITSIFNVNETTRVEPVRYPDGSSLMRLISAPLVDLSCSIPRRVWDSLAYIARHPLDFARAMLLPGCCMSAPSSRGLASNFVVKFCTCVPGVIRMERTCDCWPMARRNQGPSI